VARSGAPAAGAVERPHSYLSLVDGRPARHATWAECDRRVKGRSGARFKKAMVPGGGGCDPPELGLLSRRRLIAGDWAGDVDGSYSGGSRLVGGG